MDGTPIYMDCARFVRDLSDLADWDSQRRVCIGVSQGSRLYATVYSDKNRRAVLRIGRRIWGDPCIYPGIDASVIRGLAQDAGMDVQRAR